ncbi:MAG: hypothetical protein M1383_02615 [Patescibacteria group bacterium]|nr:hypothetical protein [Patescibacteria group bacterium]
MAVLEDGVGSNFADLETETEHFGFPTGQAIADHGPSHPPKDMAALQVEIPIRHPDTVARFVRASGCDDD